MAKVDSKGRIVLPQDIREELGITPGTEVDVREEDGRAVIEPEDDPQEIIDRMEELIDEAVAEREAGETEPTPFEEMHPEVQEFADDVRRGAQQAEQTETDE